MLSFRTPTALSTGYPISIGYPVKRDRKTIAVSVRKTGGEGGDLYEKNKK